ncbi:MAG: hypothetical protein US25_C0026G0006 [Candidatus Moranbacteria bacterium GW2011_GWE1_36_7]|nr:MAG: hypothetical protein UR99_C0040G0006 [Candidatus Moranbacteria bacterium GW2011_GWD2_36_12]KKQ05218.1 MAG: hypothetical protein US16_C0036G0006 [Candidatus Moranbacteria bacterium GW2011_GWE2_36_40]KKQ14356.1 MAG: hypothetical protein US25_C0026G0006 [Candidatus Moranbacteria bacterium GW2011_GWE1_36_7]
MEKREKAYLFFSIIFFLASLGIIWWIDRQEVSKQIDEQVQLTCAQRKPENDTGNKADPFIGNEIQAKQEMRADWAITTKSQAVTSIGNVDDLIQGVSSNNF